MTDTTYNGWTNYETWVVGMFLDGNYTGRETYEETTEVVAQTLADEPSHPRYDVQYALRNMVEESLPDLGSSLAADLLGAAMSEVNWYELADAQIENAQVTA